MITGGIDVVIRWGNGMCSSIIGSGGTNLRVGVWLSMFSSINPYGVGSRQARSSLQTGFGSVPWTSYWGLCVVLDGAQTRQLHRFDRLGAE